MTSSEYVLVDVFTSSRFGGNPLAVFPRADPIPEEYFQRFANELHLSETTFVLAPESSHNDCKVRIFTPCLKCRPLDILRLAPPMCC